MDGYFSEATKGTATGFRRTIHYFVEHQIVASKVTFANQSGSPGVPDPVVRISTSSLRFEGHTLVGSQDQRRDSERWRNGSIPYSNSPQGRRDLGLRFRVANGEGKRVEHTLPVGLVAKFPKESDAWRELGSAPGRGADRIPRMDRLGPSAAFQVRGAARGKGRTHGDQRTWWRGLRIAESRKTSAFRTLVQVTGFLVGLLVSRDLTELKFRAASVYAGRNGCRTKSSRAGDPLPL